MIVGWKAAGSDRNVASLRYRVEAPLKALRALGHDVQILDPARAESYDVAVFAKAYSAEDRALARRVRSAGGRVVFDLCDNHFYNPYDLPKYRAAREAILDMLSLADQIVCATPALARVIRSEVSWAPEPVVIGDAVEKVAAAAPSLSPTSARRFLWFGSHGSPNAPSGMADILLVADRLKALAADHDLELVVCSNDREKFERLIAPLAFPTRYIDWSLEGFPGVLASADAVIIPISNNAFTACKTHNRVTTALYAGAPVIADGIESYREFAPFCTLDDWAGGLARILSAPAHERARAAAARSYIDERWSAEALAPAWEAVLGLPSATTAEEPAVMGSAISRSASPDPASAVTRRPCQGGLDLTIRSAVTGWARAPAAAGKRLAVTLLNGKGPIATARADLPREDLDRAGMPDAACGFALPLEGHYQDAVYRVVVDDPEWTLDVRPFRLRPDGAGGYRVVFAEVGEAPARAAAPEPAAILRPDDVAVAREVQNRLLSELEDLSALVASAREAAARLVVAVGDDASLARRVLALLTRRGKPARPRAPESGDERPERPPSRLN